MIPLFTDMSSGKSFHFFSFNPSKFYVWFKDTFDDEPVGDTRACRDCQRAVFRRKLKNEEASRPLPIIQLCNQLSITRNNIEKLLPKFHDIIMLVE